MGNLDPFSRQMLMQWLSGSGGSVDPNARIEPTFPPAPAPAPAPVEAAPAPEDASTFSTKMRAAREGQKGVGRELALSPEESAKRPFVDKMRAAKAGQQAVGKEMDKAATQAFIEKMQAARAAAQAARGGGGAVAPPEPVMPMIPPQAVEPWKTPYTTQGVAGENAIGRELFGTGRRNWPPEPSEE